ncbi:MAG: phosphoribosylamine--glycine ligase [Candidatus Omnitrophota bacterium]
MKILIVGSGGREHALAWKIGQSHKVDKVYCAPGNAGISAVAECVDIAARDIERLAGFARDNAVDLTIVGPEAPLALGIVDEFERRGLKIFGPDKACARLEASKIFAKELMVKYGLPTAAYKVFSQREWDKALGYIEGLEEKDFPLVVKADGLAAGKGVTIAQDKAEAKGALTRILRDKVFASAGARVIVEECLKGKEVSVLALCRGEGFVVLPAAQDHKAVFEGGKGPNTGGMGAYSPLPFASQALLQQARSAIIAPLLCGMRQEGMFYKGVLYAGLMVTEQGPKVLEFNVRFGDPEAQAVLPLLRSDLLDIILAVVDGGIEDVELEIRPQFCLNVVMASQGYPGAYQKGREIFGLEQAAAQKDVFVFHSGTRQADGGGPAGALLTNGGRVLGVSALGETMEDARRRAYSAVEKISFAGAHYRRDIGE